MNKTVDRFKLEEQIQTVWGTKEDLDTLLNIEWVVIFMVQ